MFSLQLFLIVIMSSNHLPCGVSMGLWVQSRNKAVVFSVEETLIFTPEEGHTSLFHECYQLILNRWKEYFCQLLNVQC